MVLEQALRVLVSGVLLLVVAVGNLVATEYQFDSTEVPRALNGISSVGVPGNAVAKSTIVVGQSIAVGKISVSLYLPSTHPVMYQISLISPSGKQVYLTKWDDGISFHTATTSGLGSDTTKGFGVGSDLSKRFYFDDGAVDSDGDPQYAYDSSSTYMSAGRYVPYNGRLASFAGEDAHGTWTLQVENSHANTFMNRLGDEVGSLQAWSLHIIPQGSYTWNGMAGDGKWSTKTNWRGNNGPSNGEQLVTLIFPTDVNPSATYNDLAALQIRSITLSDGYSVATSGANRGATLCMANGGNIVVSGAVSVASSTYLNAALSLQGLVTISADGVLHLNGPVVDYNDTNGDDAFNPAGFDTYTKYVPASAIVGSMQKTGSGILTMTGSGTQSGLTSIRGGILRIGNRDALGTGSAADINGGTLELAFNGTMTVGDNSTLAALMIRGLGSDGNGALMAANLPTTSGATGAVTSYSPTIGGKVTFGYVTGGSADNLGVRSSASVGIGARSASVLAFSPSSYESPTVTTASLTTTAWLHEKLPIRAWGGASSSIMCTTGIPSHLLATGSGLTCYVTAGIIPDTATIGALSQAVMILTGDETVADVLIGSGAVINAQNGTLTVNGHSVTCAADSGTQASLITGTLNMGASPTFDVSLGSHSAPARENLLLGSNVACTLTGATALTKNGSGNLALVNCAYTGSTGTTINAGGLVASSANLGAVTVNGGFLGGTVTVGAVTVNAGGGIDPGRPMIDSEVATASSYLGTLTCSSVAFGTKSYLTVDLIPGGDTSAYRDQLNVTGTINLGSMCRLRPIWRSATAPTGNSFTIIDTTTGFGTYFFGLPESDAGITYVGGTDSLDCVLTVTGLVSFSAASYSFPEVIEPSGAVSVANLPLSTSGTGNVYAATLDGTALSSVDYDALVDEYSLAFSTVGVDPSVSVSLIYNMTIRSNREFTVPLYSPTSGAALQYPFTAAVTVTDINSDQDEKTSKCGMASGFAALFLALCATMRVVALRRSRAA